MDKKIKAKWVKALESGKYRKTQGQLKGGSNYCCLGVLCSVTGTDFNPSSGSLPESLRKKARISYDKQMLLATANDGELNKSEMKQFPRYRNFTGASFRSIAQWIRENL